MTTPKRTLEEVAERIGIWWEGHSEGARTQLAKYILAALREAADAARQEERERFERVVRDVWQETRSIGHPAEAKLKRAAAASHARACAEIIRRVDARSRAEEPK